MARALLVWTLVLASCSTITESGNLILSPQQLSVIEGSSGRWYDLMIDYEHFRPHESICIDIDIVGADPQARGILVEPQRTCFTFYGETKSIFVSVDRDYIKTSSTETFFLNHTTSALQSPLPTATPTTSPSNSPSTSPTFSPTMSPTPPTLVPTDSPTMSPTSPTMMPTNSPTSSPTSPTMVPTNSPTWSPTSPTMVPTNSPTPPTSMPTGSPTESPTSSPTSFPAFSAYATLEVTIVDVDRPGVSLSPVRGNVQQRDENATYSVVLLSKPLQNVRVFAEDEFESGLVNVEPPYIEFTPANWNISQTFLVVANDQTQSSSRYTSLELQHRIDTPDVVYSTAAAFYPSDAFQVDWYARESSRFVFSLSNIYLVEGFGDSQEYKVRLEKPVEGSNEVTLTLSSSLDEYGNTLDISPSTFVFTSADWQQERTITVQYLQDHILKTSMGLFEIEHQVSSLDPLFTDELSFFPNRTLPVTVEDSDKAQVVLSRTTGTVTKDNDGVSYTLKLSSIPLADNVEVLISNPDPDLLNVVPTQFTFTPTNWNDPQMVQVSARLDVEGENVFSEKLIILSHNATSLDPAYQTPEAKFSPSDLVLIKRVDQAVDASCEPGTYLSGLECLTCPHGFYCPFGEANPLPCSLGSFSIPGQTNCTLCPAGFACPSVASDSRVPCEDGTYSVIGEATCNVCAPGMHCPYVDLAIELDCPAGHYSLGAQSNCTACPPGKHCPDVFGFLIEDCPPGTFSVGASIECTICPPGFECPTTMRAPQASDQCLDGTFSVGGQISCSDCPAGYACHSTDSYTLTECQPGTYSLRGNSTCIPCPAGFACTPQLGPISSCEPGTYSTLGDELCRECPAGNACPDTTVGPRACVNGTYSGTKNSGACTSCPPGAYCPINATQPLLCPLGYYSLGGAEICSSCDPGYWCETGSSDPRETICPEGFFCIPPEPPQQCPGGTFGEIVGGSSLSQACQTCPPGFYCPGGTEKSTCPRGHYCPEGSPVYLDCPQGTYNEFEEMSSIEDCLPTPAGHYSSFGAWYYSSCPQGHYCLQGAGTNNIQNAPCPAGTYSDTFGLLMSSQCIPCDPGYYCPIGSVTPQACPPGTYNPDVGGTALSSCRLCEPGYSCPTPGLSTYLSHSCHPGYYCPEGTSFAKEHPCEAGFYTDDNYAAGALDCLPCLPGLACLEGTGGDNKPVRCAQGHFCPQGTQFATQYPCPRGTYTSSDNLTSAEECSPCPGGFYCAGGLPQLGSVTDSEGRCNTGHYCPPRSWKPDQEPCPAGTYTSNRDLQEEAQCSICPQGHYCLQASSIPSPCVPGTYNDEFGKSTCKTCPAGFFCAEATIYPEPCNPGEQSSDGAGECSTCLTGHFCKEKNTTYANMLLLNRCQPGLYCPPGVPVDPDFSNYSCPKGHYCPEAILEPQKCPVGTMNRHDGRGSILDCLPCTAGHYCIEASFVETGICEKGHYCPPGSSGPMEYPCPAGTYRNETGAQGVGECSQCPAGAFCVSGSVFPQTCPRGYFCVNGVGIPEPCHAGRFGGREGLKSPSECSPCPAGSYCSAKGLDAPSGLCDPGYYCLTGSYSAAPQGFGGAWPIDVADEFEQSLYFDDIGGVCPAGHYCPMGTALPQPCPPGTFNNITGGVSIDACVSCRPGHYCEGSGNAQPSGLCSPGYYCPEGSQVPNAHGTPPGFYTLEGAIEPQPCSPGTYNAEWFQDSCETCIGGFFCPSPGTVNPQVCPPGSYCPEETVTPLLCPAGTFSNSSQLESVEQCTLCTAGHYCASNGLLAPSGQCEAGHYCLLSAIHATPIDETYGDICWEGHYCERGSTYPEPCPKGSYNPQHKGMSKEACLPCDEGFYCAQVGLPGPTGRCEPGYFCNTSTVDPYPCPPGTYSSVAQATDESVCTSCPPGYYCEGIGNSEPSGPCTEGYYCTGGASTPTQFVCPPGNFSLSGSAFPQSCPPGFYNDEFAQGSCKPCSQGHYCPSKSLESPLVCPAGFYCPAGTVLPEPCPIGTFSSRSQVSNVSECLSCPAGSYCDQLALMEPAGRCEAGFYCFSGATTKTPLGNDSDAGGVCWPGHYCEEGSSLPEPCPIGTYNPTNQSTDISACIPCDPGHYCAHTGAVEPTGECQEGFFCTGGAYTASPTDLTGGVCPVGHFCVTGSTTPALCHPGSYMPETGHASCYECPEGNYCDGVATDLFLPCPQGSYCPPGTGPTPVKCPPGTFGNSTMLKAQEECSICPRGFFCATFGLSNVTGPCEDGFVCNPGSITEYGGGVECYDSDLLPHECPLGHYCNYGRALPCPHGTYNDQLGGKGLEDCRPCEAGFWCFEEAIANQTDYLCPVGHYCESHNPLPIPCPVGTYRDEPGAASVEDCFVCPPGFYCPGNQFNHPTNGTWLYWLALEGSSFPLACPEGTFCEGRNVVPQLCPLGTKTKETAFDGERTSAETGCEVCPPGTFGADPLRLSCHTCQEGHVCLKGAKKPNPISVETDGGYECPPGFYCPAGVLVEVPCPVGTFNNDTGGVSKVESCLLCESKTYNNLLGQSGCKPCASSSVSEEGSIGCKCLGRNRAFEPTSGKCLCIPGFEAFDQSSGLSVRLPEDEDGVEDCQPITYKRCGAGEVLSADGTCVTEQERCKIECGYLGKGGKLSVALGVCDCEDTPLLDQVCNNDCRQGAASARMSPTSDGNQTITLSTGEVLPLNDLPGYFGRVSCNPGDACDVIPCSFGQLGDGSTSCHYDAGEGFANNLAPGDRRRRLSDDGSVGRILQPVICIQVGDSLFFEISTGLNGTRSYPVYKKDSLLNTNPNFDYSAFRYLREATFVERFAFTFNDAGIYVFGNSQNLNNEVVVSVQSRGRSCPTDGRIVPRSTSSLLALGAQRNGDLILEPDWTLIGALFGGMFGLVVLIVIVLFSFKQFALGTATIIPAYRKRNNLTEKPKKANLRSRSVNPAGIKSILPGISRKGGDEDPQAEIGFDRWGEEDLDARQILERLVNNHDQVQNGLRQQGEHVGEKLESLQDTLTKETEQLRRMLSKLSEEKDERPSLTPELVEKIRRAAAAAAAGALSSGPSANPWNTSGNRGDESIPLEAIHERENELLEKHWSEEEKKELEDLTSKIEREDSEKLLEQQLLMEEQLEDLERSLMERDDIDEEEKERILADFMEECNVLRDSLDLEKRRQQEDLKNRMVQRKLRNFRTVSRRQRRARKGEKSLRGDAEGDGFDEGDSSRASTILNESKLLAAQEESELAEMDLSLERERLNQAKELSESLRKAHEGELSETDMNLIRTEVLAARQELERKEEEKEEQLNKELAERLKKEAQSLIQQTFGESDDSSSGEEKEVEGGDKNPDGGTWTKLKRDDDTSDEGNILELVKGVLAEVAEEEITEKVNIEAELRKQAKLEQEKLKQDLSRMMESWRNDPHAAELVGNLRKEHDEKLSALNADIARKRKEKYEQLQARLAKKRQQKVDETVSKFEEVASAQGKAVPDLEDLKEEVEDIVESHNQDAALKAEIELEERRKEDIARRMELEKREAELARREAELVAKAAALKKGEDAEKEIAKIRETHESCMQQLDRDHEDKRKQQREALRKRAEEKRKQREAAREEERKKAQAERELQSGTGEDGSEEEEVLEQQVNQVVSKLKKTASQLKMEEEEKLKEVQAEEEVEHQKKIEEIKRKHEEERKRVEEEMERQNKEFLERKKAKEAERLAELEEMKRKEMEELARSAKTAEELQQLKEQHEREFNLKVQKQEETRRKQREKLLKRLEEKKARKQALLEKRQQVELKRTETSAITPTTTESTSSSEVPTTKDYLKEEASAIAALFQQGHFSNLSPQAVYQAIQRVLDPRHTKERKVLSERQHQERAKSIKEAFSAVNAEKHAKRMDLIKTGAKVEELEKLDTDYKERLQEAERKAGEEMDAQQDQESKELNRKQAAEIAKYVSMYSRGEPEGIRMDEQAELDELGVLVQNERQVRLNDIQRELQEDEMRAHERHKLAIMNVERAIELDTRDVLEHAESRFEQQQQRLVKEQEKLQAKQLEKLGSISAAEHAKMMERFSLERERLLSSLRQERLRQRKKLEARIARLKSRSHQHHDKSLQLRLQECRELAVRKQMILEDSLRKMFEERAEKLDIVMHGGAPGVGFSPPSSPLKRRAQAIASNLFKDFAEFKSPNLQELQMFRRKASLANIQALSTSYSSVAGNSPPSVATSGHQQQHEGDIVARLSNIERMLSVLNGGLSMPGEDQPGRSPFVDPLDQTLASDAKELKKVDETKLEPQERGRLQVGRRIIADLGMDGEVSLHAARCLPPSRSKTVFRNSLFWDPENKHIYVRLERFQSLGDLSLVLFYALAHVRTVKGNQGSDSFDDRDPAFLRELHGILRKVAGSLPRSHTLENAGAVEEVAPKTSGAGDLKNRMEAYAAFSKHSAVEKLLSKLNLELDDSEPLASSSSGREDNENKPLGHAKTQRVTRVQAALEQGRQGDADQDIDRVEKKLDQRFEHVRLMIAESEKALEAAEKTVSTLSEKLNSAELSAEESDKFSEELETAIASKESECRKLDRLREELKHREERKKMFHSQPQSVKGALALRLLEEVEEEEENEKADEQDLTK